MRTDIEWAELHAPLFLAGTNLGQKLDPAKRAGLKMEYAEDKRHLYVSYGGKTARIPETSVLSMVERAAKAVTLHNTLTSPTPQHATALSAQVSTPQSHVFAGLGGGQTGQEPPKRHNAPITEADIAAAAQEIKRGRPKAR